MSPVKIIKKDLLPQYKFLYDSMVISEKFKKTVEKKAEFLTSLKDKYQNISLATSVPWWVISLIHHMECGNDFNRHLHNGDPLSKRTIQVPKGRPTEGEPPFTFEESAIDALEYERLDLIDNWSIPEALFFFEGYNGWGYRKYHPEVLSPYLWSMSNHYTKGKYTSDGKFDSKAISGQVGIACLIKMMEKDF